MTSLVPTLAVFLYETVRHDLLDRLFPTDYGNLLVGLLVLGLAYGFSTLVFGLVERLQAQAIARSREIAALRAAVEERERLSRELHDGLAQLVASLVLDLGTALDLVAAGRQREALAELERLRARADDVYADVREAIGGLRVRVLERGLRLALEDELREFEERHGIDADLRTDALPEHLPATTAFQLLRIVQEALANVRKHAGARRTWVTFGCRPPATLELVVSDDGRGFDPATAVGPEWRSFGLETMRERAETLGGTLRIESRPGGGTRIVVAIPVGATAAGGAHGPIEAPAR